MMIKKSDFGNGILQLFAKSYKCQNLPKSIFASQFCLSQNPSHQNQSP
ncbi:hypothetical protein [Helicobacter sp. T3_23-1056]